MRFLASLDIRTHSAEVGHRGHRPASPGAVAPVVAEQRLVGDSLPEPVELLGVPLDLLFGGQPGPELEEVPLGHRHVDELPGGVPLDHELVGGDDLEDACDLPPDSVQIGGVHVGPLARVVEEAVDRAVGRGQRHLETHPLRDHPLLLEPVEHRVRLPCKPPVGEIVETDALARPHPPAPDPLEILDRLPLGVTVRLLQLTCGRERLLQFRHRREDHQRQHPDPVHPLRNLTVRQPADVTSQPLRGGSECLFGRVEREASHEQDVASAPLRSSGS